MHLQTFHCAAVGFEAARHIEQLPADHRSRRLHGHSFVAKLRCALPAGWAAFPGGEVEQLKSTLAQRLAPLDYRLLNEHVAEPSDEHLAQIGRAHV